MCLTKASDRTIEVANCWSLLEIRGAQHSTLVLQRGAVEETLSGPQLRRLPQDLRKRAASFQPFLGDRSSERAA